MRTYDYILAMKEEELDSMDDSDFSSDESTDFDSPEKPTILSRFLCKGQRVNQVSRRFSVRIEGETETKPSFHVNINPSIHKVDEREGLLATEKAREKLAKEKSQGVQNPLKSLPLETKRGPLMHADQNMGNMSDSSPFMFKGSLQGSPGRLSSPTRRLSGSANSLR